MHEKDDGLPHTRTVARALELLDCIADAKVPLSVVELARLIGASRSTAYRLLRTLSAHGYVSDSFSDSDKVQIGPKVLKLATSFYDHFGIRVIARPHLIALRDRSGETIHLVVPYDGRVLHIDRVETLNPVRMYSPIGALEGMHCTSVGKAILAALPDVEVDAILRHFGLPALTANTITDPDTFRTHLRTVRAQGYATVEGEDIDGFNAVGVAIVPYSGPPVGAISISAPAYRFSVQQMWALVPDLKKAAEQILQQMNLRGPHLEEQDPNG